MDIWSEFAANGSDGGVYGEIDRALGEKQLFDRVIAPPPRQEKRTPSPPAPAEECQFCRNNGEPPEVYGSHKLKDKAGKCCCPILRKYRCPTCRATGDKAHTIKYCPKKRIYNEEDTLRMHRRRKRCRLPSS